MSYEHRQRLNPAGGSLPPPLYLPDGRGVVIATRMLVHRAPRQNPYTPPDPQPSYGGEITIGLKAGRRMPEPRRYRPYEPFEWKEVDTVVDALRHVQLDGPHAGYTIYAGEGRYESAPENSLRIVIFPHKSEFDTGRLAQLRGRHVERFFRHLYELAEQIGERFEQDELIVAERRCGRELVSFQEWR